MKLFENKLQKSDKVFVDFVLSLILLGPWSLTGKNPRKETLLFLFYTRSDDANNRTFSLTWQSARRIYWNKRTCLPKKRVPSGMN